MILTIIVVLDVLILMTVRWIHTTSMMIITGMMITGIKTTSLGGGKYENS